MIKGIVQENTRSQSWLWFVNAKTREQRITKTTKDLQMCTGGITMIYKLRERPIRQGLLRKYIKEISGHLKGVKSKLKEKRTNERGECESCC